MNHNFELIEYIYTDAEMATFTLKETLKDLEGKDNKIKVEIEDILKGYETYEEDAKEQLIQNDIDPKEKGFMAKMGADMGIKKEVLLDNSDASIAEMLIKGISMGSLDMEKKIEEYKKKVNQEVMKIAYSFLKFQQEKIKILKKYL